MAIVVDPATLYQTIDGVGASAAQAEQWSDADADFWFTSAGIGLTVNRMNISSSGYLATAPWATPFGTSPGNCLANTQKIAARGARIVLMPQLCPEAWTEAIEIDFERVGTRLLPAHYGDFAAFVRTALDQCSANGITVYGVAPHNEADQTDVYGMFFTPDEYWDFVHNHVKPAIAASTQPAVKVLLPDAAYWSRIPDYLTAFSSRGHSADFDIISGHNYAEQPTDLTAHGKPVWQTEIGGAHASYNITDAIRWAKDIHYAFATRGLSSFQFCAVWELDWLEAFVSQNGQGLADNASAGKTVRKRAWAFAHYGSRFIPVGSRRVACSGAPAGVSASAYKSPTDDLAIVAVNENLSAAPVEIAIAGVTYSASLAAQSITTFTRAAAETFLSASRTSATENLTAAGTIDTVVLVEAATASMPLTALSPAISLTLAQRFILPGPLKVWNGTSLVDAPFKLFDGSTLS